MPLVINDIQVEHFSGLYNIHVLTPKNNDLPIILHLGEEHKKIKKPCKTEPNSMDLPNFLTQLNLLASEFRVEMYSENFLNYDLLTLANKKKDLTIEEWEDVLKKIARADGDFKGCLGICNNNKNTTSCYYKDLKINHKDIYKEKCEYPNIVWQFSDARKTFFSRHHDVKYNVENTNDVFLDKVVWIIRQLLSIFDDYYKNYRKLYNHSEELDLNTLEKKYEYAKTIFADDDYVDLPVLIDSMQLIVDYHENPERAAETIINVPAIKKQFRKQNIFTDFEEFKHHVKEYIFYVIHTPVSNENSVKIVSCYLEFMKASILFLNDNSLHNFEQRLLPALQDLLLCKPLLADGTFNDKGIPVHLMIAPSSIFVDLYFVLRILKPQKKDFVCNLAGAEHTNNITYFLTHILRLYNIDTNSNTRKDDDRKQCLPIPFTVNLNNVLKEKKRSRSKSSSSSKKGGRKKNTRKKKNPSKSIISFFQ